jgi:amino acid transporter
MFAAPDDEGLLGLVQPVLPSEGLATPATPLSRGLRARDLTTLALIAVLLVTNVSLLAGAGGAAFVYLLFGIIGFLLPSALVCAQLYRLFPGEGGVYLWANKAFGSFWDMLIGFFCHWWPGAFGLVVEVGAVVTYLQAINPTWLASPWQAGVVEIAVLLLVLPLCALAQAQIQRLLNLILVCYLGVIALLGLAGVVWMLSGHLPQGDFSPQGWQVTRANLPLFATVILSLLGLEVPLNLGGEVAHRAEARRYLLWGVAITIVGYLIATFAIITVLPPQDAINPAAIGELLQLAFGRGAGGVLGFVVNLFLVGYFVCAAVVFNLMFARLLFVVSVDWRAPFGLHRLNRERVPFRAMVLQVGFSLVFLVILFLIVPALFPSNPGESFLVFLVTINGLGVVWELGMIGLFASGLVIFARHRRQLEAHLVAPPFLLSLAAALGAGSSILAIILIFIAGSPLPGELSNEQWFYWVALVVLGSLALGALLAFMMPEAEDASGSQGADDDRAVRQDDQYLPPLAEVGRAGRPLPY